jgi:hypothetical protein
MRWGRSTRPLMRWRGYDLGLSQRSLKVRPCGLRPLVKLMPWILELLSEMRFKLFGTRQLRSLLRQLRPVLRRRPLDQPVGRPVVLPLRGRSRVGRRSLVWIRFRLIPRRSVVRPLKLWRLLKRGRLLHVERLYRPTALWWLRVRRRWRRAGFFCGRYCCGRARCGRIRRGRACCGRGVKLFF